MVSVRDKCGVQLRTTNIFCSTMWHFPIYYGNKYILIVNGGYVSSKTLQWHC